MTDEELKKHQAGLDQAMKDAFETACKNSTSKYQAKFKEEFSNHKDASEQTITDAIEQYRNSFGGTKSALEELGIGEINLDSDGKLLRTNLPGSSFVNASDCTVIYNGAEFKNSTNSITVNGLTIQAHEVTTQPLKVTVNNDTQTVYNTVKKYNEVLKELTDLCYADSSKGYDVLTDEEKKVMSADQIEKWENKIKGSLLRRDSTLAGLISTMQSITTMSVTVDGKKYTLADFGIGTFDYTEKGLLHIDGDSDDPSTSDKKDRLMIALNENPDLVMQVLSGIGSQLYSELGNKMSATKSSSALTFYNDKEIKSMKTEHKDEIKKWETKLADLEKKWYSKFAKMESSLAKLNAQTSYISSLFTSGL